MAIFFHHGSFSSSRFWYLGIEITPLVSDSKLSLSLSIHSTIHPSIYFRDQISHLATLKIKTTSQKNALLACLPARHAPGGLGDATVTFAVIRCDESHKKQLCSQPLRAGQAAGSPSASQPGNDHQRSEHHFGLGCR
jgi:hypothetical protein